MTAFAIVLKRVTAALFTLLAVSIAVFVLSLLTPGDPVESMLAVESDMGGKNMTYDRWSAEYKLTAESIGRAGAPFYFSISQRYWPDTLHRIHIKQERQNAKALLKMCGDWSLVEAYMDGLRDMAISPDILVANDARYLLLTRDADRAAYLWNSIQSHTKEYDLLNSAWHSIQYGHTPAISVFPKLTWYGLENQYHIWLTNILKGDFGVSIVDGRPVSNKIGDAVAWTLRINIVAILLAFGIAIPLGLSMARKRGSRYDLVAGNTLFIFFAIPSFWLGTLLIVFFTTPEYSRWLDIFPAGGIGNYHFETGGKKLAIMVGSLILPVISLLLGALAYVTRQMRDSVVRESEKPYVRMARAKGLSEKEIYRSQILRNALFPMITLVGSAIPASVSGSVVIEVLFGIPGMGRLMYSSILSQDWQVVYVMVLIAALLTVIGYLISDILYRLVDPRVGQHNSATA